MKKRILAIILALLFLLPTTTFATDEMPDTELHTVNELMHVKSIRYDPTVPSPIFQSIFNSITPYVQIMFSEPIVISDKPDYFYQTIDGLQLYILRTEDTPLGAIEIEYIDGAGNDGQLTVYIGAPLATIWYSVTEPTNENVIATVEFDRADVTITNNGGNMIYTFTENGSFTFEFEDMIGNTGTASAIVTWIDREAPTATVSYSTMDPTNENVTATITPSEDVIVTNNGGSLSHAFTENGSFTFEFEDIAGNTGFVAATVDWIEEAPEEPDVPSPTIINPPTTPTETSKPDTTLPADIAGHWAENEIKAILKAEMMEGYPDGTFAPERNVTRAELAAILCRFLDLTPKGTTSYPDTVGHWASGYIAALTERGILTGYDDGKFYPDREVSRQEIAVILHRTLRITTATNTTVYTDSNDIAEWAKEAVENATATGWLNGYPDGSFKPQNTATRAEIATIFTRL